MKTPIFSLILATYGRVDEIGRLLDSLQAQTCQDFELIVVDQNSDNRVLPFVHRAQAAGWAVIYLRLTQPNLSAARNAGIAAARGAWVAFPDDDCWYEPETLERVKDTLVQLPTVDGVAVTWVEQIHKVPPQQDSPLQLRQWERFQGSDASSITLFLKADRVRASGGFDVKLGVGQWYGAGEETDLVIRMLRDGAVIERLLDAKVHHAFGTRLAGRADQEYRFVRGRGRGWGGLCAKNRLPGTAVLRGLIGPLGWPIFRQRSWLGCARAAGALVGRWQGYLRWQFGRDID